MDTQTRLNGKELPKGTDSIRDYGKIRPLYLGRPDRPTALRWRLRPGLLSTGPTWAGMLQYIEGLFLLQLIDTRFARSPQGEAVCVKAPCLHTVQRCAAPTAAKNVFGRTSTRAAKVRHGRNMNDHVLSDYLRAKKLYGLICNHELGGDSTRVQERLDVVRQLECLVGKTFRNSAEFHREVQAYIDNGGERLKSLGKRIRRARKAKKWTLKRLASELGYRSHSAFIKFEKDKRLPPKELIEWLLAEERRTSQDALRDENVSTPSIYSQE